MTNARILVVDDENDIRELVREILSEEGYIVETAGNAAEARAACAQQARGFTQGGKITYAIERGGFWI